MRKQTDRLAQKLTYSVEKDSLTMCYNGKSRLITDNDIKVYKMKPEAKQMYLDAWKEHEKAVEMGKIFDYSMFPDFPSFDYYEEIAMTVSEVLKATSFPEDFEKESFGIYAK